MINNFPVTNTKTLISWINSDECSKLQSLSDLQGKKSGWIRSDLSIKSSNWLTRLIWSMVAKHFSWMRKHLYGVDLDQSRSLLQKIGKELPNSIIARKRYYGAVEKFNCIAPKHAFDPKIVILKAHPNQSLKAQGYDTKEKLLELVEKHGRELESLQLDKIKGIGNIELEKIVDNCPNLCSLSLYKSEIDDTALFLISKKLSRIKELSLDECPEITDRGLEYLATLKSLLKLELSSCDGITDRGLKSLQALKSLVKFNLSLCYNVTSIGLAHLGAMSHLEEICLIGLHQTTDRNIKSLRKIKGLKVLNLTGCEKITDDSMNHIASLPALEKVILLGCNQITKKGLMKLKDHPTLRRILLLGFDWSRKNADRKSGIIEESKKEFVRG